MSDANPRLAPTLNPMPMDIFSGRTLIPDANGLKYLLNSIFSHLSDKIVESFCF